MGLFKKILNEGGTPNKRDNPKALTALVMLFDTLPKLYLTQLENAISQIEPLMQSLKIDIQVEEKDILHAFLEFDNHKIKLVGLSAPVPSSTIEHTIPVSNWKQEDKLPLSNTP